MDSGTVLLDSRSPHGHAIAVVEEDDATVYLYVVGTDAEALPMRSVWIRNRVRAPGTIDRARIAAGLAPVLPEEACCHPEGLASPAPDSLRVVWSEEGDAVALWEGESLLAVSNPVGDEIPGASRDCREITPVARPLLVDDYDVARGWDAYWARWDGDFWPYAQAALLDAYAGCFGPEERYFAIDGGGWPPGFLTQHRTTHARVLITGGLSLVAQPRVGQMLIDPRSQRRVELAMAFASDVDEATLRVATEYLAARARLPWRAFTWLGRGHTVGGTVGAGSVRGGQPDGFVLVAAVPGPTSPRGPALLGEPVTVLFFVAINADERARIRREGSEAVLRDLWPRVVHSGLPRVR